MRPLLLLFYLFIFSTGTAIASDPEDNFGTVRGTVTTSDGEVAADVTIQIKGTTKGTITDENGGFEFRKLLPGSYTLQVYLLGFEGIEQEVTVAEGKTAEVSFRLQISNKELNAVVVTGTRKYRTGNVSPSLRLATPILELSQNIQVITKGILADQQSFDMLEGIQRNVSGAQKVEHWDNYARINMRGTQLTAFRNGMNVTMPWGPLTEDMSMVERIEFVKGPAGFMLANGEPSGLYNIVTKKPSGVTRGEVSLSLGSYELYRTTADFDGKLSKDGKLLYRFNLMGQMKGSHRDFEYNNRYSVVPVIKYLVDDRSSITLEYTHQYSQMNVIGSNYAFSSRGYGDLPVSFTTAESNLDPSTVKDNSVLAIFEHKFNDNWKFTAQGNYIHYDMVGQSIWPSGILKENDSLMQRGISIWDALGIIKTGQMFLNGELRTGSIGHKLLAGLDMGHKDYYADWNQAGVLGGPFNIYKPVFGAVPVSGIPVWDRSRDIRERGVRYNSSYNSVYIQDELAFLDNKIRLTLAGRYTNNKDNNPYEPNKADDDKFTPRLGLSYSIDKNTAAYFVYDQAFLPNFGTDWQGKSFDPITGNNLELGVKKDWFNGKWNSALAVYQITRNNVLTADLEHEISPGQYYSRQSGQQQTKGIEFDLKGQLARNFEAVVNYALTDARITKDSDPKVIGNQVAGATKHLQNTWLSYKISDGLLSGVKFSLGYQYQSGRSSWYSFDNSENSLPDYFRLDGGISYSNSKFGVNFNVNNLLNEYLYSGAPYAAWDSTYKDMFYWQVEPKRNSRITVSYKF